MSANVNRVILAGNLTRDPQVRFLANEKAIASFGLAMNRKFKGADGSMKEEATFVDIEAWGKTGELVGQYLHKGSSALIEGRLKLDTWEDKEGKKRTKLVVVADSVQFLDSKGSRAEGSEPAGPAPEQPARPTRPAAATGGGASGGDDEPPFATHEPWSW